MARGVNEHEIIGNLGADPELRYTDSGTAVCNLSIGVSYGVKQQDGSYENRTEWLRAVLWGRNAEVAAEYAAKGRQVRVVGPVQTRKWEDNEGNTRYSTETKGNSFMLLGTKADNEGAKPAQKQAAAKSNDVPDDDLPF